MTKPIDKRKNKEYNGVTKKRPYNPEVYKRYRAKQVKRKVKVCQLPECKILLKQFAEKRQNKYCSPEHAVEGQKIKRRKWDVANRERVLAYKKKYYRKQSNETAVSKTR